MSRLNSPHDDETSAKLRRIERFLNEAENAVTDHRDDLRARRHKLSDRIDRLADLADLRGDDDVDDVHAMRRQVVVRRDGVDSALDRCRALLMDVHRGLTIVQRLRVADADCLRRWLTPLDSDLGLDDNSPRDISDVTTVVDILEDLAETCGIEVPGVDDDPTEPIEAVDEGIPSLDDATKLDSPEVEMESGGDPDPDPRPEGEPEPGSLVDLDDVDIPSDDRLDGGER